MKGPVTYKSILAIALPVVLSGVSQNIVNIVDTVFLAQLGNAALGAAGNGVIFYFMLVSAAMGLTTGAQIIMGRRNGEHNLLGVGKTFNHSLLIVFPIGLCILFVLMFFSPMVMGHFTQSEEVYQNTMVFLNYRSYGAIFLLLQFAFVSFYVGITDTKPLIIGTLLTMITNVVLDYGLIFGHLGLPKMGVAGAALASVIAELIGLLYLVGITVPKSKTYGLFQLKKIEPLIITKIFKIGSPTILQNFLTVSSWLILFLIIEKMGVKELGTSHILRSIYMVLMIPVFGFSAAANTLTSNLIGGKQTQNILPVLKRIIFICLWFVTPLTLLTLIFPGNIISFYSKEMAQYPNATASLRVISMVMFIYTISFILFNGVLGTGATLKALLIEFTSILLYNLSAYFMAIKLELELPIVWTCEFIYFSIMGLLSVFYLKKGQWENI